MINFVDYNLRMKKEKNKYEKLLKLGTTAGVVAMSASPTLMAAYSGLIIQPIMKIGNPFQNGLKLTILSALATFNSNELGKKAHICAENTFDNVEKKIEKVLKSIRHKKQNNNRNYIN